MSGDVRFLKMSGAGNDFVVLSQAAIERIEQPVEAWVRQVCRRRLAVGADGVLIVGSAGKGRVSVRFHNPDGSRAFCGNGSRCAARFAWLEGLAGSPMILDTEAGPVTAEVAGDRVRLVLRPPTDDGESVVEAGGDRLAGRRVTAGVPHFVVFVERVDEAPLPRWGPAVRRHESFAPLGTNLDVVSRTGRGALDLRTWERGVENETLACGSGAVAAAFAARLAGGPERWTVSPRSGVPLTVELPGPSTEPVEAVLAGDARVVFEGRLRGEPVADRPPGADRPG